MRFRAPMQAWGTRSRFEYRDTEREPTLSGVVGIIAAAEGLPRGVDLSEYLGLTMTVRVDREGELSREFQTARDVLTAEGKVSKDAQIIYRDYLADAAFHVALEGDSDLLTRILSALHRPRYPIFLGRKAYVPSLPVVYPGDESLFGDDRDAMDILTGLPVVQEPEELPLRLFEVAPDDDATVSVRFLVPGADPRGESRRDIPLQFDIHHRRYATRFVETIYRDVPVARIAGSVS